MAISRMQTPRQLYGLGSFVKKLTRKVTKPFTKVAKKLVPKEIAGIMRIAAPFVGGPAGTLMYLSGTAKQKGRISPMDLALAAAPYAAQTNFGKGITQKIGNINVPFTKGKDIRELLVGKPQELINTSLSENPILAPGGEATSGIFGKGGSMYKIGKGGTYDVLEGDNMIPKDISIFDTKAGQKLFGKKLDDGTFAPSYTKIGAQALAVGDFINTQKQLEKLNEGASDVVEETTGDGLTDSEAYENFLARLALLNPESFRVPERLRLPARGGGLMRTNFAIGSGDDDPKPLPEDPTKPVNPFGPKPIKPLGDMKMAGSDRYQRILEDIINEMEDALGRELTNEEYDLAGQLAYEKLNSPPGSIDYAKGGRVNYALGTRPTAQESGLGGLPIEADMRYTGGFMPYGAKEKADDVPARLSKNEFVFTADAVRAAGGGSVQKGAQKMYNTMKQLESKPEAKGMMA